MKLVFKIAIGVVIGLFIIFGLAMCAGACTACTGALFSDEETEEVDDEYEDDEYYEDEDDEENCSEDDEDENCSEDDDEEEIKDYDSDGSNSSSSDDFYGGAVNDDEASTAPKWGDGTVRSINSSQFFTLVAKKSNKGDYIGKGPCVVDFWASWCGYCKQISPYMERLAKKYKGKVQFYKVNADNCGDVTSIYGIESLPTVFFCAGEDIEVTQGAFSENEYDSKIKSLI